MYSLTDCSSFFTVFSVKHIALLWHDMHFMNKAWLDSVWAWPCDSCCQMPAHQLFSSQIFMSRKPSIAIGKRPVVHAWITTTTTTVQPIIVFGKKKCGVAHPHHQTSETVVTLSQPRGLWCTSLGGDREGSTSLAVSAQTGMQPRRFKSS